MDDLSPRLIVFFDSNGRVRKDTLVLRCRDPDSVARLDTWFVETGEETSCVGRTELGREPRFLVVDRSIETAKVVANPAAKLQLELDEFGGEQSVEMQDDSFGFGSHFDARRPDVFAQSNSNSRNAQLGGVEFQLSTTFVEPEGILSFTSKGLLARVELKMEIDRCGSNVLREPRGRSTTLRLVCFRRF
jgi:hypothetical protein